MAREQLLLLGEGRQTTSAFGMTALSRSFMSCRGRVHTHSRRDAVELAEVSSLPNTGYVCTEPIETPLVAFVGLPTDLWISYSPCWDKILDRK